MRLGIPREYLGEGIEPGVRDARARRHFASSRRQGATLQEVSLPSTDVALSVYYIIAPAECSSNLARYDGVRFGSRVERPSLTDMYLQTRGEGFGNEVKRRVMLGTYALSSGYYDAYYRQAQKVRTLVSQEFDAVFKDVDAIVCPTSPSVAFPMGSRDDPLSMYMCDVVTLPANLAGIPGISVPCGFVDGLPVGLQVIAPRFEDARVFRVAARVRAGDRASTPCCRRTRARPHDRDSHASRPASDRYEVVIGLEVHAQLLTRSKMFCPCPADYTNAAPNENTCPVCLGMPGCPAGHQPAGGGVHGAHRARAALRHPAVHQVRPQELLLPGPAEGLSDLAVRPAAVASTGTSSSPSAARRVRCGITRVHLEEDTGTMHHAGDVLQSATSSLDRPQPLRRAAHGDRRRARPAHARGGARIPRAPAPDPHVHRGQRRQPREGILPLRRQRLAARARCQHELGVKVEVKNMNSFRAVQRALEFEIERQTGVLDAGGTLVQETRGWVETQGRTISQRSKEQAHDYRYFPEPDLPPLRLDARVRRAGARRRCRSFPRPARIVSRSSTG